MTLTSRRSALLPARVALLLALGLLLALSGRASAANVSVRPIPAANAKPGQLMAGPHGWLWFTEPGVQHEVGVFDPHLVGCHRRGAASLSA